MSAARKPDEVETWKQFLEEEIEKMQKELEGISDPQKRSEFKDQLTWLRHQVNSFKESEDTESIQENYEWVAKSFNHNLKPKSPFRHKP